jgi:hypothetical protein
MLLNNLNSLSSILLVDISPCLLLIYEWFQKDNEQPLKYFISYITRYALYISLAYFSIINQN